MTKYIFIFSFLFIACADKNTTENKDTQSEINNNIYRDYFSDGKLKLEVEIINGLQNGTLKEYYKNGQLKASQDWRMGDPVGNLILYDSSGALMLHKKMEYEKYEDDSIKVFNTLYIDTLREFKQWDRVAIKDSSSFNKTINITPISRKLKFGVDNKIEIYIPNVPLYSLRIENATIGGSKNVYFVKPKSLDRKVQLYISAYINDNGFDFTPIDFDVEE